MEHTELPNKVQWFFPKHVSESFTLPLVMSVTHTKYYLNTLRSVICVKVYFALSSKSTSLMWSITPKPILYHKVLIRILHNSTNIQKRIQMMDVLHKHGMTKTVRRIFHSAWKHHNISGHCFLNEECMICFHLKNSALIYIIFFRR